MTDPEAPMTAPLRPARPADADAVTRIVRAAYAPYIPRIGREPGPMGDDYAARIAAGQVQVLDDPALGVCGVLVLEPQADAMLLDNIALAPEAQGKGHGKRLMAAAEAAARAAGFDRIRLYTHEKMFENIALYAALGYAETGRVQEKGFDRVYMEKPLG
ncbi:GNAT family N-acetyltransferase [Pseudooceanicola sp. LIPI14-2-Ac024]|uniref:GNAT family N-acetyltransferase n=1 Tax=Pseudooceanicola sp. LIPI14-2-Ac024 TaxID=3344875 RepID=UPI0035CF8D22